MNRRMTTPSKSRQSTFGKVSEESKQVYGALDFCKDELVELRAEDTARADKSRDLEEKLDLINIQ